MPCQAIVYKAELTLLKGDVLEGARGLAWLGEANKEKMKTIDDIWQLLNPHGEFKRRRGACERLWQGYGPARQEEIYVIIEGKLQRGEFVNENPYFAIEDNAPKAPKQQVLSYDEHYRRYGTDLPQDGFRKVFLPDQQKTIYVKG